MKTGRLVDLIRLVDWGLVDWGNWRNSSRGEEKGELIRLLGSGYYMCGLNTIHYGTTDQQ